MAERLHRQAALGRERLAQGPGGAVELASLKAASRFIFRGDASSSSIAGRAFGVPLSSEPCRAAQVDDRAALWLGPDEWLLLAPEDQGNDVCRALSEALGDHPHALVPVGHRNTGIEISGKQAATLLNAGCPLDLDVSEFPVGMCTRTVLGRAEIVLWRTRPEKFHLDLWRSFAPYVWDFLIEARARL